MGYSIREVAALLEERYPHMTRQDRWCFVAASFALDYSQMKERLEREGGLPESLDQAWDAMFNVIEFLSSLTPEERAEMTRDFEEFKRDDEASRAYDAELAAEEARMAEEDRAHAQWLAAQEEKEDQSQTR